MRALAAARRLSATMRSGRRRIISPGVPVSAKLVRDRDWHRRAQFRTVGSRLYAEQHVQRVHRRLESGFQDWDLRLDLGERSLGLVHLEFGRDALSEQLLDQGEQLPAGFGLLPGNREARLQAPDRDVHI